MHRTFVFPIICESPQIPSKDVQLQNTELGIYITGDMDMERSYNAFDHLELIPSLIEIAEKIKRIDSYHQDKRNVDLVVKWVKKWGFLNAESFIVDEIKSYGQHIGSFIDESFKFRDLWLLYKIIANRDIEGLKKIVDVIPVGEVDSDELFFGTHLFWFYGDKHYRGITEGIYNAADPLKTYQIEAMTFIGNQIEPYINNNKFYWRSLKHESSSNQDHYKFTPGFGFESILDAIYMQFFILMNENTKKICPICNKPFDPYRMDQIYCSDSCKHTAKSRRYRARKNSII